MIKGFRDFVMRGNVLDLAVAVVIGAAFAKVIDGLVTGIINPLIAAAVYFVLIVPVNKLRERFVTEEEAAEAEEIALLREIRDALKARPAGE